MADVKFPAPTGEYKVGTTTFSVIDESRFERLGNDPGTTKRKIAGRFYYPVLPEDAKDLPYAKVMSDVKANALAKTFHAPVKPDDKPETFCYQDAKPAGKFPFIIFSHGMGSYAESNHSMCIDLCSHGYTVLAVGHAYEAVANEYEDGTVEYLEKNITKKVYQPYLKGSIELLKLMYNKKLNNEQAYEKFNDFQNRYAGFILDRLEERVKDIKFITDEAVKRFPDLISDPDNIGVYGHSIGGATAYCLCMTDDRFKAGINLDGMLCGHYEGMTMHKPFYQVSCDDAVTTQTRVVSNTDAPVYWSLFKNMRHQGFSDLKFIIPIKAVTGKMAPQVMHENLIKIQKSFFDKYIKGEDTEVWYPENDDLKRRA